jgi:hypothetical protein
VVVVMVELVVVFLKEQVVGSAVVKYDTTHLAGHQ